MQADGQAVHGESHWVTQGDTRLFVWEKYLGTPRDKPVVVLAHGSATAGRESFDLKVPGHPSYSLMDFLAQQGFDVFALDVRGFGSSTHPDDHLSTEQASADLNAVVDAVCQWRGVAQVHLLAWSWGTQYGGMFVMAHPQKVARYISYAQMHAHSPDLLARRPRLATFQRSPYIRITESGWKLRFDSMTPPEANEPAVVEAFARSAALVETRSPTGPQVDLLTRLPMVDATRLTVPVMMIHGQYDDVADLDGLLPFFRQLPHSYKRYVVIPDAGHMMHLQKGHRLFQQEVAAFLAASA
ncbi:alpha/beta fold hydrolase [Curvibacter delicatus]|jgi:pimeloyl-ACP methyl ester carboxylesterase|uniref:alpha/beta fold hydrolase n=1 Tax=Curvibacter delicatus TaxID=80879 RepID=UPI00082F83DF|nr:alpha/beta hydrolase [Curvibacter delicatus]